LFDPFVRRVAQILVANFDGVIQRGVLDRAV
jgi:hypothetical protein